MKDFKKSKDNYKNENKKKFNKEDKRKYNKDGKKSFKSNMDYKNFKKNRLSKSDEKDKDADILIRLNKYIANAGICSRREADTYIAKGHVKVNDKVVTEVGTKVSRKDKVKFKNKKVYFEKSVYIVLNKPKGVLTTVSDDRGRKTVIDIIKSKVPERIYPVGRLDKDSTGVLLLTNDGDLTKKLTHPKYNKKKIYHAFLDKELSKEKAEEIATGAELEDGFMKFDTLAFPDPKNKKDVGIEIHSGRNRIIRRMFSHFGFEVVKLDRVYFAGLTKKDITRGRWRHLTEREVSNLKRGSYE